MESIDASKDIKDATESIERIATHISKQKMELKYIRNTEECDEIAHRIYDELNNISPEDALYIIEKTKLRIYTEEIMKNTKYQLFTREI